MQNLLYLCALFGCIDLNLITLILTIAILFGLTDFLTERFPRLQRDIYYIAFGVIAFLFTIKYYYGADIWNYVNFYQELKRPQYILSHPDDIPLNFEIGYALFCSVLKSWGVSYYWHTVIISIFYFTVIAILFTKIERKRSFALAILVVLDYNCIFAAHRQCMAVGFFILMILCLEKKRYLWMLLCAALTIAFHKSGAFVVGVVLFYNMVRYKWVPAYIYQLLLFLLVLVFLLPIVNISSSFVNHLPLQSSYISSIQHHLGVGRQLQIVFLLYAATIIVVMHFNQYKQSRMSSIAATAIVGLVVVVVFYQYYYILWRIRSYFIPIVIVYGFSMIQQAEDKHIYVPYGMLLKQACSVFLIFYLGYYSYSFHKSTKDMQHPIYTSCTVFDLIGKRSGDVQKAQLLKARLWWEDDFQRMQGNKLDR